MCTTNVGSLGQSGQRCCGAVNSGFDPQETLDVHCGNGFDEYRSKVWRQCRSCTPKRCGFGPAILVTQDPTRHKRRRISHCALALCPGGLAPPQRCHGCDTLRCPWRGRNTTAAFCAPTGGTTSATGLAKTLQTALKLSNGLPGGQGTRRRRRRGVSLNSLNNVSDDDCCENAAKRIPNGIVPVRCLGDDQRRKIAGRRWRWRRWRNKRRQVVLRVCIAGASRSCERHCEEHAKRPFPFRMAGKIATYEDFRRIPASAA